MAERKIRKLSANELLQRALRGKESALNFPDPAQSEIDFVDQFVPHLNGEIKGFEGAWDSFKVLRLRWVAARFLAFEDADLESGGSLVRSHEEVPNIQELVIHQIFCGFQLALQVMKLASMFKHDERAPVGSEAFCELMPTFFSYMSDRTVLPEALGDVNTNNMPLVFNLAVINKLAKSRESESPQLGALEFHLLLSMFTRQIAEDRVSHFSTTAAFLESMFSLSRLNFEYIYQNHLRNWPGSSDFRLLIQLMLDFTLQVYATMRTQEHYAFEANQRLLTLFLSTEVRTENNWAEVQKKPIILFTKGLHFRDAQDRDIDEIEILSKLQVLSLQETFYKKLYAQMLNAIEYEAQSRIYFSAGITTAFSKEVDPIVLTDTQMTELFARFTASKSKDVEGTFDSKMLPFLHKDVRLQVFGSLIDAETLAFNIAIQSVNADQYFSLTVRFQGSQMELVVGVIDKEHLDQRVVDQLRCLVYAALYRKVQALNEVSVSSSCAPVLERPDSLGAGENTIVRPSKTKGTPERYVPHQRRPSQINSDAQTVDEARAELVDTRYRLEISDEILQTLRKKFDSNILDRILEKIDEYNSPDENNSVGQIKVYSNASKLKNKIVTFRVGKYRVLANVDGDKAWVYDIVHRRELERKIYN